jgi:hypothetical protein
MADRSSTYTLKWAGDYSAGAAEAAKSTEALVGEMAKLQTAAKGGADALATVAKAGSSLKKVENETKGAGDKTKEFSAKVWGLGKIFKISEKEAESFLSKGALPMAQVCSVAAGAAMALVAAIAAVTLAVVAGTVAFVAYAISAANAARAQNLFAQAATGSITGARDLEKQVAGLAENTGLSAAKLMELGLGLGRAGVQGVDLARGLNAVAIATSTLGDAAGAKIAGIAEEAVKMRRIVLNRLNLAGTGVGIDDVATALAKKMKVSFGVAKAALQEGRVKVSTALDALSDAVEAKLGGIAKKQALDFGVQMTRLKSNIAGLFKGIDLEPLLGGLHDVLSVFSQSTVSGQGLKVALQGIAAPLIDGLTALMPLGKGFFQGMIIAALQVVIIVLKIRNAIRDAFGGGAKSSIDGVAVALVAGRIALYGIAAVVGLVALGIAGLASLAASFAAPFVAAAYGVYKAFGLISEAVDAARSFLSELDFGEVAKSLIDGLVNGIKSGATFVIEAIKGLGSGAMTALKSVLGIASPSKVFKGFGINTAQGYAEGVDVGAPEAQRSVADMVGPMPGAAGGPLGAQSSKGGAPINVTIETLNINGVRDAAEISAPEFSQRLAEALERLMLSVGGPLPAPEGSA